ncbi:MAG: DUF924 family protein [Burkholderiaceae bacterium]
MRHFTLRPAARDILTFWFGTPLQQDWPDTDRHALWFGGGADLDRDIRERFAPLVEQAAHGGLADWEPPIGERLALVLLLDQFSRNVHRGTAAAFAGDARAQQLVRQSVAQDAYTQLPTVGQVFLFMPFMHAEDLALQDTCVTLFQDLIARSPPELQMKLAGNLSAARQHRDIVARFGRFPHRNAALGRQDSPDEVLFLHSGPRFGQ